MSAKKDIICQPGTVVEYDSTKGIGRIELDDGMHVLLHKSALLASGRTSVDVGERFEVEALERPARWEAFRLLSLRVPT